MEDGAVVVEALRFRDLVAVDGVLVEDFGGDGFDGVEGLRFNDAGADEVVFLVEFGVEAVLLSGDGAAVDALGSFILNGFSLFVFVEEVEAASFNPYFCRRSPKVGFGSSESIDECFFEVCQVKEV